MIHLKMINDYQESNFYKTIQKKTKKKTKE